MTRSPATEATGPLPGLTIVVGLGVTGWSAVRALVGRGAQVAVADTRAAPPNLAAMQRDFPNLELRLGVLEGDWLATATRLIVSPGVALDAPEFAAPRARGIPLWSDIELFARLAAAPVAAITGSNGKSTVTELLGRMAAQALDPVSVAVGGNLGVPALDLLPAPGQPGPELYVLELSSFQLEATHSLGAAVATVLNVSADHLDRYAGMTEYAAAKQRIFERCGCAIVNADDPIVAAMGEALSVARCYFTAQDGAAGAPADRPAGDWFSLVEDQNVTYLACNGERWMPVDELGRGLRGRHNWSNALAAFAMGQVLGFPVSAMRAAARDFAGLPHRCEEVAVGSGVRWINDSKGTNVGATVAALEGLPGPLVLLAGGDGKRQDFTPLGNALAATKKIRALIVLGCDGPAIASVAPPSLPVYEAVTLDNAVQKAAAIAQPGDSVVLSPACASFDMFDNYQQRGDAFRDAALAITQVAH